MGHTIVSGFLRGKYDTSVSCSQVRCEYRDVLVIVDRVFDFIVVGVDCAVSRI